MQDHYYQPLYTLIGAGVRRLKDAHRLAQNVMPLNAKWVQDYAATVNPKECYVQTAQGDVIQYEYLIIAVGINNDYSKVTIYCCNNIIAGLSHVAQLC